MAISHTNFVSQILYIGFTTPRDTSSEQSMIAAQGAAAQSATIFILLRRIPLLI